MELERTPRPPSAGVADPGPGYLVPDTCPYKASPPVLSGKVVSKHAHSLELWGRGGLDLVQDHTILPLWSQEHISPSAHRQHLPTHCPRQQCHDYQVPSAVTPCPIAVAENTMSAVQDSRESPALRTPMATAGATLSLAVVFLTQGALSLPSARESHAAFPRHTEECGTGWGWQHRSCAEAAGFQVPLLNTNTLPWAIVKSFSQRS